uniref:Uncharacterized protein n=1 Tax=Rhizophora mucronata TaxID=61149 RepID=A0A2P2NYC2_RHIMU
MSHGIHYRCLPKAIMLLRINLKKHPMHSLFKWIQFSCFGILCHRLLTCLTKVETRETD